VAMPRGQCVAGRLAALGELARIDAVDYKTSSKVEVKP
jgi:hypothetical protein